MSVRDVIQAAAGSVSAGGGAYIEDVFSTWLYTGNGSTQTIRNGIALADGNLPGFMSFDGVRVYYDHNHSDPVRAYVEYSNDGSSWTSVGYIDWSGGQEQWNDLAFSAISAAYWRLRFTDPGDGNIGGQSDQIREVQWRESGTYITDYSAYSVVASNVGGTIANTYDGDVNTGTSSISEGATLTYTKAGEFVEGQGGLVWIKGRDIGTNNALFDTERGVTQYLSSNGVDPQDAQINTLTAFNSDGFNVLSDSMVNADTYKYVSWTFKKTEKFFDVVTYTGTGTTMTVPHSLGSVPGCIIVKGLNAASAWDVYHVGTDATSPQNYILRLSTTAARSAQPQWNNTAPTSTEFTVKGGETANVSGRTYVAYLFAHDAGGFGDAGDENVISCGSYTGNGSSTGPTISLGYEPQFLLIKNASDSYYGVADWVMFDVMRGIPMTGNDVALAANTSAAEANYSNWLNVTATGFDLTTTNAVVNQSGSTFIYIAIRRGPMKTPESGTDVFAVDTRENATPAYTSNFPVDLSLVRNNKNTTFNTQAWDRLRSTFSVTNITDAEDASNYSAYFASNTGFAVTPALDTNDIAWMFRRAPGFFDVVCYTGTSSIRTVPHNLGIAPEMIIIKQRNGSTNWQVYHSGLDATSPQNYKIYLNLTNARAATSVTWNSTAPTSSVFTLGDFGESNNSGQPYVAYLFATCPGVSKVGTYTGNGTGQNIDCGFSNGARFVMIKKTNSTGDWTVFDTARGIVSGNDPRLSLNNTNAEITSFDYIDPYSGGFALNDNGTMNGSGDTYIYLAIA